MFKILGDTHLGRTFVNNVPLHRRGEREKMVFDEFNKQLAPDGASLHVHMGDLFDKFEVSLDVLMATVDSYRKAAAANPGTTFVILRGNHDANRNLESISSFDIFAEIVAPIPNIMIIKEFGRVDRNLFMGWHPVKSAKEMVNTALRTYEGIQFNTVWGHWDVDLRSSDFNLIPTDDLSKAGIKNAYTGHVHLAQTFERDSVSVQVTGSMMPFAHGEGGDLYVTITKQEALANPDAYKNKCVRVELAEGELWDGELDCLQFQLKRPDKKTVDEIDVKFDLFDLNKIFEDAFNEARVPKDIQEECMVRWRSMNLS